MPSSEQYADAIRGITFMLSVLDDPRQADTRAVYSLALRWLRVGAAMEAGGLEMRDFPYLPERFCAEYQGRTAYAPDPLTAAERAMGVGT